MQYINKFSIFLKNKFRFLTIITILLLCFFIVMINFFEPLQSLILPQHISFLNENLLFLIRNMSWLLISPFFTKNLNSVQ